MTSVNELFSDDGAANRASPNLGRHKAVLARIGSVLYVAWGLFHLYVAWDIFRLGVDQDGIVQGRVFQLAAYMLSISLFVIGVALRLNWRNSRLGYWLNLCVAGWADLIWVAVVVAPGYVGALRGLVPPAIFLAGALTTSAAIRHGRPGPRVESS